MTHPLQGIETAASTPPPNPAAHLGAVQTSGFALAPEAQAALGAVLQASVPPVEEPGFHPNNLNAQAFTLSPTEAQHLAQLENGAADPRPAPDAEGDVGELVLDLTQIGLDIVGIFEPTPFADGANTLISIGRGDWFGAITSAAGIVPYLGDAAKLGKLGRWAETVVKAVDLAASNPAARRALEPAIRGIKEALDAIPQGAMDSLPASAREALDGMKTKIDDFFRRNVDEVDVFAGTPYSRADYDDYVARKIDAGETPRSPEEYVEARDHWRRGGEAHRAAVNDAIEDLSARFPDAEILETPSLRTANGDLTYPDVMVIDEDAGTVIFVEVKTGGANLTRNQRALLGDLENATFSRTQARELQIRPPDQTLGELFEDGLSWEEFRGPGYKD